MSNAESREFCSVVSVFLSSTPSSKAWALGLSPAPPPLSSGCLAVASYERYCTSTELAPARPSGFPFLRSPLPVSSLQVVMRFARPTQKQNHHRDTTTQHQPSAIAIKPTFIPVIVDNTIGTVANVSTSIFARQLLLPALRHLQHGPSVRSLCPTVGRPID